MSGNKTVTLYGNATCPYCGAARMLLTKKAIKFDDVNVSTDPASLAEMRERSGNRTVPQIFIGDTPIGGFDELYALDNSGELDKMLAD
ncbi:MAG: glutaredoxin 3 [Gammaproteobacteria bacterium]|nr:glutaredoxin 3 [Gammaproteobacteria bacterium]